MTVDHVLLTKITSDYDVMENAIVGMWSRYDDVDDRLQGAFRHTIHAMKEHLDDNQMLLDQYKLSQQMFMEQQQDVLSPVLTYADRMTNVIGANLVKMSVLFLGIGGSYRLQEAGSISP